MRSAVGRRKAFVRTVLAVAVGSAVALPASTLAYADDDETPAPSPSDGLPIEQVMDPIEVVGTPDPSPSDDPPPDEVMDPIEVIGTPDPSGGGVVLFPPPPPPPNPTEAVGDIPSTFDRYKEAIAANLKYMGMAEAKVYVANLGFRVLREETRDGFQFVTVSNVDGNAPIGTTGIFTMRSEIGSSTTDIVG
jgi:hypothetical protein